MLKLNVGCGGSKRYPFKDFNCAINLDAESPRLK